MKIFLSTLCALTLAISAVAQNQLPSSLQHLRGLANDEDKLVNAARLYHRQQVELNEWDYETIRNYKEDDRAKMMKMYDGRINTRTASVKTMWEYVLSVYPKSALAMNYMGEYWYDLGGNQHAGVKHWKEALMLNGELALAHNNMGLHYTHYGDPKKGLISYLKAIEIEPKNPDFLYNMAQFYMTQFPFLVEQTKRGKPEVYKAGMEYSKRAAEAAPDEDIFISDDATNFYAAENFDTQAKWPAAAQAWRDAHAIAPGKVESFFTRLNEGRCWIFAGRKAEAIAALSAARDLNPSSDVVTTLMARAQEIEGVDTSPKRVKVKTQIVDPSKTNAQ